MNTNKEEGEKNCLACGFHAIGRCQETKDGIHIISPSPTEEKKGEATGEWEKEFREYFDKVLKPKKPTIANLDRELIIDFIHKLLSTTEQASFQDGELNGRTQVINITLGFLESKGIVTKDYITYLHTILEDLDAPQEHTKE